ncbi:MAG: protein O-mannosyl-transferase family [Candidatus Binatia bacterium]
MLALPLLSLTALLFAHLFVPAVYLFYLLTIPPTILWRDTPEFANSAFTLSIAHPAGFPTYALLVKLLTFIPVGSIAFKTNLASAVFSLLTLLLLCAALRLLIKRLYPLAPSTDVHTSSVVAAFLFALGPIVWQNAISTEVYTLNILFLAGLIYLILRWMEEFDPRWFYISGFLYGLSAGNHATVALFLPGLLAVHYIKRPKGNSCEWMRTIFFFFLGLSVYLYLPVRSLANPAYDWGDPQSLRNFLYQITDQKDFVAGDVSPESNATSPFSFIFNHLSLIALQFSPLGVVLILLGAVPALRGERGLSLLFLWILVSNHFFFWRWESGDAFLPSYLVLAIFIGVGICNLLGIARKWGDVTSSRVRPLIGVGLTGLILVQIFLTYPKMNKRDYYLPSDFFRTAFRSLDPGSVFITEIQWFHIKYLQDIERLRQDISVVSLNEIDEPWAFHYITPERHPKLIIPLLRQVPENASRFITELVTQNNRAGHPIFIELTDTLNQFVKFPILAHQDFVFRVSLEPRQELQPQQIAPYMELIEKRLFNITADKKTTYDPDLHVYLDTHINALAHYLDDRGYYKGAVGLLRLYLRMYGPQGRKTIQKKNISMFHNNMGLSELHQGDILNGLKSLDQAIQYDPKNPRPYLILASWYLRKAPARLGEILERARRNGLDPKGICATLSDDLLKAGQTDLLSRAKAVCENAQK